VPGLVAAEAGKLLDEAGSAAVAHWLELRAGQAAQQLDRQAAERQLTQARLQLAAGTSAQALLAAADDADDAPAVADRCQRRLEHISGPLEVARARAEQAADLAARLLERRLELARQINKLSGATVAEPAEVLRDLDDLAQPTAAAPATRALLKGTPGPAPPAQPALAPSGNGRWLASGCSPV
jgi:hypothetical protein